MPLYDYKCASCGHIVEVAVRLNEEWRLNLACPACPGGTLERQPSAPNFTVGGYNAKNGYSDGNHNR